MSVVRVAQLSDTHFLEDGSEPEGGAAYDTAAGFDAVFDTLASLGPFDLVTVTGDVADHGRPAQYRRAADAFARFDAPVNVCPGNHDFALPFAAGIGGAGVGTSRVMRLGDWAFVFVDSSAGLMAPDGDGLHRDPPGEARLHNNGVLGRREAAWLRAAHDELAAAGAAHVFVWLHHPPSPSVPLSFDADYAAEWDALLADLPLVRGLAGGHTHIPDAYEFADRPVFVCPSLKNNFSLDPDGWLPPGCRTFSFAADGTVTSEVHYAADDDDRWPRRPFGRTLRSLFMGEITHAELAEIVARRAARAQESPS